MSFDFDEFDELISAEISPKKSNFEIVSSGFGGEFSSSSLGESAHENQPAIFRNAPIFTVSDFIATTNGIFENTLPSVLVEGEISNFKVNQGKFVFFDLKDESSSLPCFLTVWQMRFPLEDGMKVVAKVQPKLTDWGRFSLTVQQIIPRGEGNLKRSFDILKAKLAGEGLFAVERKREIPRRSQNIAVISSTQAAGYADFVKILNERWGGIRVRVAHTQVQGLPASDQIIRALEFFNSEEDLPDVIAIIRGGGSADDLAVFNDEKLVRAVASSRVPIISGIGHETDETLVDLAADFAASTPSNVAQILTPEKSREIAFLRSKIARTGENILSKFEEKKAFEVGKIARITAGIFRKIEEKRSEIQAKIRILENLNPEKVLRQGYAILRGEVVVGRDLQIETSDKIILAEVKNVERK